MQTKKYLSIILLLAPSLTYSMNIIKTLELKENPELVSIIFNDMQPDAVLKNFKTFTEERDEKFDLLTKMVSPKVVQFIQNKPDEKTAQTMNRCLNLVASKMAYFIAENVPVLQQYPLAEHPQGNPIHALFSQSARMSRDAMALLLPIDYFLNRDDFLKQHLGEKAELVHTAFLRSVEQLGMGPREMVYIDEGRIITPQEAQQMNSGMDILGSFAMKSECFQEIKRKIKKSQAIELVDGPADMKTHFLLKNENLLQKNREDASKNSFNTSLDGTLALLISEQGGSSFKSVSREGHFAFGCSEEPQQIVFAIADHKTEMIQKICDNLGEIRTQAEHFDIDPQIKKFFLEQCQETQQLGQRAIERSKKLTFVLAEDAKIIGPRAYALSNLYGTIAHLAKNNKDRDAVNLVHQSLSMYQFISSQE